jgi:transcriptional regulator with XRE-family HTH domain
MVSSWATDLCLRLWASLLGLIQTILKMATATSLAILAAPLAKARVEILSKARFALANGRKNDKARQVMRNVSGNSAMKNVLKSYRDANNLNQSELAEMLGISRNYLSLLERGKARNPSQRLYQKILNLWSDPCHATVKVTLPRRVKIDAVIAPEIVWLNAVGVITESSCQGPPPTALIKPSSVELAKTLSYTPEYHESGYFEIILKTPVPSKRPQPDPKSLGSKRGSRCGR